MIKVVVLVALVACVSVSAQQRQQRQQPQIIKYNVEPNSGDGRYSFEYEVSDGTSRQESGSLQNAGSPDEFVSVQGVSRWTSPEGWLFELTYTADGTGYHPVIRQIGGGGGFGGIGGGIGGGISSRTGGTSYGGSYGGGYSASIAPAAISGAIGRRTLELTESSDVPMPYGARQLKIGLLYGLAGNPYG